MIEISYAKVAVVALLIVLVAPASAKTHEVLNATCNFSSAWTYHFDDDTVDSYSVINQCQ